MTYNQLKVFIEQYARLYSIIRINNLFDFHRQSTKKEMEYDWNQACALISLFFLNRDLKFNLIDSSCYKVLEDTWIESVKQHLAYFAFLNANNKLTQEDENYYYEGCETIRQYLFNYPKLPLKDFKIVQDYLNQHYLKDNKIIKNDFTEELIAKKARRLYEITGNTNKKENWFRAELYVKMFYENIIPAVTTMNIQNISNILKAFEFSKSKENRFYFINAFEVAIAIFFLDNEKISKVKGDKLHNFNLVAVDNNWPLKNGEFPNSFRFEEDSMLIIFEGIMSEKDKHNLMNHFFTEEHKSKIEGLNKQSCQEPYEKMIL